MRDHACYEAQTVLVRLRAMESTTARLGRKNILSGSGLDGREDWACCFAQNCISFWARRLQLECFLIWVSSWALGPVLLHENLFKAFRLGIQMRMPPGNAPEVRRQLWALGPEQS